MLEAIPAHAPQEDEFAPELVAHLPQFIARVSPASRAVLILHYFHEMSLTEIAAVLGVASGTVKSRLAYGLQSLRRAIRERGDERGARAETALNLNAGREEGGDV